jgi:carboxylesterase
MSSCKKDSSNPPIDENVDLDGTKINDSSLSHPASFLLSAAIPSPTPADLSKPVVIAAHGFSASTFEWTEFRDWAKAENNFYTSIVLLGGHGRDYADFKAASWEDWQAPIITEYNKLRGLGYKKINIVGSSTGCPLVLDMVASGKISPDVLKHLFFIDPIIIPSNKTLSLVSVVGPVISYTTTSLDPGENGFWYKYRPQQALKELNDITREERKKLEKGITLPSGVTLKVYKAEKDDAADPASAVLLQKGIKLADGSGIDVEMVNSNIHVFTRLHGRATITADEKNLQLKTFEEIQAAL